MRKRKGVLYVFTIIIGTLGLILGFVSLSQAAGLDRLGTISAKPSSALPAIKNFDRARTLARPAGVVGQVTVKPRITQPALGSSGLTRQRSLGTGLSTDIGLRSYKGAGANGSGIQQLNRTSSLSTRNTTVAPRVADLGRSININSVNQLRQNTRGSAIGIGR